MSLFYLVVTLSTLTWGLLLLRGRRALGWLPRTGRFGSIARRLRRLLQRLSCEIIVNHLLRLPRPRLFRSIFRGGLRRRERCTGLTDQVAFTRFDMLACGLGSGHRRTFGQHLIANRDKLVIR